MDRVHKGSQLLLQDSAENDDLGKLKAWGRLYLDAGGDLPSLPSEDLESVRRYYELITSQESHTVDWNRDDADRIVNLQQVVETTLLEREQQQTPRKLVDSDIVPSVTASETPVVEPPVSQSYQDRVAAAAEPLIMRLRAGEAVTADDFFALPLFEDVGSWESEFEACCESMLQTSQADVSMEQAAGAAFDFALVPFPVAVALYTLQAIGGFPAKICWGMLLMLVCWQARGFLSEVFQSWHT